MDDRYNDEYSNNSNNSSNSDKTGLIIGLFVIVIIVIGAGIYYLSKKLKSSDIIVNVDASTQNSGTTTTGSGTTTTGSGTKTTSSGTTTTGSGTKTTSSGNTTTGSGTTTTGSGTKTTGSGTTTTGTGTTDTTGTGTTDTTGTGTTDTTGTGTTDTTGTGTTDTTGTGTTDTTGTGTTDTTGTGTTDTTGIGTTDTTGTGTTDTTTITPSNTITGYDSYKSSNYMITDFKNTSFGISSNTDGEISYSFKGNEFNVCSNDSTCGGIKISDSGLNLGTINAEQICFGDICINYNDINVSSNSLGKLVRTSPAINGGFIKTNITFVNDDIDPVNDSLVDLTNYNKQSNSDGQIISRILVNPGVEIRNINDGGGILNSFRNNSSKPIIILNSTVYGTDTNTYYNYIPDDLDTDSIYIALLDNTITAFYK